MPTISINCAIPYMSHFSTNYSNYSIFFLQMTKIEFLPIDGASNSMQKHPLLDDKSTVWRSRVTTSERYFFH